MTYEYECPHCGYITEEYRAVMDRNEPAICDKCGKDAYKVMSKNTFILKGDGWTPRG